MYFSLFLLPSSSKNSGGYIHICKTNRDLKVERRQQTSQELETKEKYSGKFPEYFFLLCPRSNTREAGNSETPMGTDKRGKTKEEKQPRQKPTL